MLSALLRRAGARVLTRPRAYLAFQQPFAAQKIAPVLADIRRRTVHHVLDVGCGPGTNAALFGHLDYVGVDLDEAYIRHARATARGTFFCADAAEVGSLIDHRFDVILFNSLFHHLDDDAVGRTLRSVRHLLSPGGTLQLIDLVLPDAGVARHLALADRGRFARTEAQWQALLSPHMSLERFDPFALRVGPAAMWRLVHIAGVPTGAGATHG